MSEAAWLPLFPLDTVLFPAARRRSKISEARYIQMAATGIKSDWLFGVVRIKSGKEVARRNRTA